MRRLASVVVGRAAPRLRPFNHGSQVSFITGSAPSRPSADLCFASGPLSQPVRSCNGITLPAGASFHSPQVAGQHAISRCFSSIPSFSSAHDANSSATGSYILRAELADAFAEGGPDAAAPVFDSIPPEDRTISEWMAMISRSARDHRPALALRYLNLFLVNYSGLPPIVVDVDASFGMTRSGIPMSELDMIDAYRFSPSIHSPFFSPDRHHAVARARADRRDALPSAEGDSLDLQALIRYASLSAAPIPRVLPSANAMRAVVESIIHVASLARDGAAIVGAFADPGAGAGALYLAFPCARPEDQCEAASSAVPDNAISVSSSSSDTVYHPSWPVTLPARAHHTQLATCSLLVMRTAAQLGLPLAADNIAPLLRRLSRLLPSDTLPDIVDTMDIVAVSPAVAPAYPDCPPTPPGPLAEAEAAASTVRGAWACAAAASLREPSAKFLGSLASVAPPGALRLTHVLEMSRPAILSEAVALAVLRATAATTEAARIGTHVAGVNALSLVESVRTMAQREGTGSMELEIQYARALQLAGRAPEAWGHLASALAAPEAAEGDPAVIGGAYSVLLQSLSLMPSLTPVQRVAVAATVFRMLQTRAGVDGAVPAPAPAVDHLVFLVTRTRDWALITDILAAIICQTPLRATIASALLPHALPGARGRDCFDWSVAVGSEGDALAAIVEVFPEADWEAALLSRAPTLVRYQEALLTVTDDSVTSLLRDLAAVGGAMTAAAADPASDVVFLCPLSSVSGSGSGSGSGSSDPAPGEEEFSTAVAAASANPLSRGGFKFSAYFGPHTISNVLDTFSSVSRPVAKRAHTAPSSSSSSRDRGKDRDSRGQAGNAKDDEGANAVMAAELTHFPPSLTRAHAVASLYSLAQAMDVLLSPRMTRALIQALIATTPDPAAALSVITDLLESAAEAGVVMDRSFAPLLLSFAFGIDPAAGLQVARTLAAMGIPISSDAIKTVLQAAARAGASRAVHEFFPKIYGAVPEPAKGQQQLCDGNTPSKGASYESFSSALSSLRTGPLSVPAASAEAVDSDRNLYESVFLATQVGPWATASRLDALMALNCVDSLVNMQLEHLQHQQQHQQGGYGRGRNGGRSGRSSSSSSNNGSNDPLAPLIAALTLRVPFDLANAAEQVASVSPPVQGWAIMRRLASAKDVLVPTVLLPYAPALSLSRLIGTAMTVYRALGALATPGELDPEATEAVRRAFTVADDAVTAAAAAVDAGAGASPMPRKAFASSMGGLFSSTGASSALSASTASSSAPVAASVQAASSPFALPLSVLQGNYRRLRKIRALVSSEARLGQQLGRSRKMMLSPQAWAGVSGEVEELVRPLGGIDRIDWALLPKNVWEGACGAIPSSRPPDAIPKFVPFRDEGAAGNGHRHGAA